MKNTRKILVPTDFSEAAQHAYQYALLLADRLGADVHLLHAIFPIVDNLDTPLVGVPATQQQVESAKEVMHAFAQSGLALMRDRLDVPPQVMTRVEVGAAVVVIHSVARKEGFPLIIMGTQGEHNSWDRMLGTITAGVVGKATCPIVVVPENTPLELPNKVAYATDLLEADAYEIWRALQLLAPLHTSLDIVHFGTDQPGRRTLTLKDLKTFLAENLRDVPVHFHQLEKSKLAEDIRRFATQHEIDLMIMYRVHRNFWEQLFHRSRTKEVAQVTDVPLLVV